MARVVIVGAGISGLALAYRLQSLSPRTEIQVVEARDRPGGCAWTQRDGGFQVEIGPNGFLDSKPSTVRLCHDLGLGDRLIPASEAARRHRYLFLDGRLRALPGSFRSFIASDLLSWRGKLRFLAERFQPRRRDPADESVAAFARRRAGREVAEVFADALVTGIHAGDPALLSVAAAFPRLANFEREHGSVMKGMAHAARERRAAARASGKPAAPAGQMWSFRDGIRVLVEALAQSLRRPPLLGAKVLSIARNDGPSAPAWKVVVDGQESSSADAVVLTCPAPQQAGLLKAVDEELASKIGGIAYNRVVVVGLGYRRADVPHTLDGFGYIAPQRFRRDILGVQWCSTIYPERSPDGSVLMRALAGGWHRPEIVDWDDDRLLEAVRAELFLALGVEAVPAFHSIVRWDQAIPQYHLGHGDRVDWIEQRLDRHPGLFLGGNAYRGVALNDCTERAEVLAQGVRTYLAGNSSA